MLFPTWLPNEDFGRLNQPFRMLFEALFKGVSTRFGLRIVEKCFPGKRTLKCLSDLPTSSFGEHKFVTKDYAPQTKISEGVTKDEIQIFD